MLAVLALLLIAAAPVLTPGKKISGYPHTATAPGSALIVLAITNVAVPTNNNILVDEIWAQFTNGLATTSYVLNNGTTVSNGVITQIGASSNSLVLLIVSSSNAVASANVFKTNQWTTNGPSTPVNGRVWFQGFEGQAWSTNNARNRTWEWDPTNQSVRIGSIGNVGFDNHHYIPSSNFWDAPNIGYQSYAFGSNHLVNAPYSTIAGGTRNLIYTNAGSSFIGGGTNNSIETNSTRSFIGGGKNAKIHVDCQTSVIGGGEDNEIGGGSQGSVIVGGLGNLIKTPSQYAFMGGGANNSVGTTGGSGSQYSTVAGGNQNIIRGQWSFIGGGRLNNMLGTSDDFCVIAGGDNNTIGTAPSFPSSYAFIGGGRINAMANDCDNAVIVGGRENSMAGSNTNGFIGGGYLNSFAANKVFQMILGGERNSVNGSYSFAVGGASNQVDAARAGVIGHNITNTVDDSVIVGNLVDFRAITTVTGSGTGSTNYTLQAISPKSYLGSSNVNIVAVMQTIPGRIYRWRVAITNDSPDTWGFSASSTTNRWFWQSYMYGTNAPVVLTNNTALIIDGESEGTNTEAEYKYFRPAK